MVPKDWLFERQRTIKKALCEHKPEIVNWRRNQDVHSHIHVRFRKVDFYHRDNQKVDTALVLRHLLHWVFRHILLAHWQEQLWSSLPGKGPLHATLPHVTTKQIARWEGKADDIQDLSHQWRFTLSFKFFPTHIQSPKLQITLQMSGLIQKWSYHKIISHIFR